ncbi:non-homologous end joining protein Ku [Actinomarinicola tropica]|uniref:Non-homologous end joining protein Ku n=1 Tax=Actinomarinicola tropica TaxID=2789776 RepID=A0A5Q2RRA4_9ACTN|nr:Ku protein [Actinomarinicola tropica]QGG96677.1 Ku protein [Actinomarinicola tropica]
MPRAMWSGAISFGLVNIPVKLFTAVTPKTVRFNQIDSRTGSRVRQKLVAESDGSEVSRDQIVKGYELRKGDYVIVDEAELAALDPDAGRSIDIEEFVDLADIDPIYFDKAYWLAPDKGNPKPYALLAESMAAADKVGIARLVLRSKQYLAAIRSVDGVLVMSTMSWADEINRPETIPELDGVTDLDVSEREQALATQLIESLSAPFEPEKYHDTYREQVLALIEAKAAGDTELVSTAPQESSSSVVDLMAALEASVAARAEAKGRHPASTADAEPATTKAAAKKKAPARKKATAKKAPAKKAPARKSA